MTKYLSDAPKTKNMIHKLISYRYGYALVSVG